MKRFLSILLALMLPLGAVVPAFAHSVQEAGECNELPVVIVRGMDFTGLYVDYGTENQRSALAEIKVSDILGCLTRAVVKGILNFSTDPAIDEIIDYANYLLDGYAMNIDGSSKHNVGYKKYPQSAENYNGLVNGGANETGMARACIEQLPAGHTYYLNYDWRANPLDVADEINELVNTALKETGHDKVKMVCSSMGGIMTVAYLTKYGYDKVERCLFMSSTFCGAQVASDLLCGKIDITAENLYNFLNNLASDNKALSLLIKSLKAVGAFSAVTKLTDFVLENYQDEIYEKVLTPVFGHMLTLWGLVQPEDFDEAINYMFGDTMEENAAFIKKAQALQNMMNNRDALLKSMMADGVKIAVVCAYDSPVVPAYKNADFTGDGVLETYQMSGYATVAKYGETLGDDYTPRNAKYLSPDRAVDLSTALFPDHTYIIKNAPHVSCSYGTDYNDFFMWLLTAQGDFYAGVNPKYPQFMQSDKAQTLKAFN